MQLIQQKINLKRQRGIFSSKDNFELSNASLNNDIYHLTGQPNQMRGNSSHRLLSQWYKTNLR